MYLAHDITLGRKVAIKVISASRPGEDAGRRLLREAQAAAALDHPNICTVHEIRSEAGRSFIVMQYCEGETLADRLHRGRLAAGETIDVVSQVANALAFAHNQGLVHRDVKPQNIMVGSSGRVTVLDFGLAKSITPRGRLSEDTPTETQLTAEGVPIGTAAYMSPEQIKCEPVDGRADLFALGVVMYQCLTGRRPFEGRHTFEVFEAVLHHDPVPPATVQPGVPQALSDLCMHLLARAPHERPQSAEEVCGYLAGVRYSSGTAPPTPVVPPAPRASQTWVRSLQSRAVPALAGALAVSAFLGVVG